MKEGRKEGREKVEKKEGKGCEGRKERRKKGGVKVGKRRKEGMKEKRKV